jgi:hypothetical protein
LVATVSLHYTRASQGLDTWEEHVILAPLDEELSWESAGLFGPEDLDLDHDAPDDLPQLWQADQDASLSESSEDTVALQSVEASVEAGREQGRFLGKSAARKAREARCCNRQAS